MLDLIMRHNLKLEKQNYLRSLFERYKINLTNQCFKWINLKKSIDENLLKKIPLPM